MDPLPNPEKTNAAIVQSYLAIAHNQIFEFKAGQDEIKVFECEVCAPSLESIRQWANLNFKSQAQNQSNTEQNEAHFCKKISTICLLNRYPVNTSVKAICSYDLSYRAAQQSTSAIGLKQTTFFAILLCATTTRYFVSNLEFKKEEFFQYLNSCPSLEPIAQKFIILLQKEELEKLPRSRKSSLDLHKL